MPFKKSNRTQCEGKSSIPHLRKCEIILLIRIARTLPATNEVDIYKLNK